MNKTKLSYEGALACAALFCDFFESGNGNTKEDTAREMHRATQIGMEKARLVFDWMEKAMLFGAWYPKILLVYEDEERQNATEAFFKTEDERVGRRCPLCPATPCDENENRILSQDDFEAFLPPPPPVRKQGKQRHPRRSRRPLREYMDDKT